MKVFAGVVTLGVLIILTKSAAIPAPLLAAHPPPIPPSCPHFPSLNVAGALCEDFDSERNGQPGFQFSRLPIGVDPNDSMRALGDPNDDLLGYTQTTDVSPAGTAGRVCSNLRGLGHLGCDGPVSEENDWHLHSPYEGPGEGYDPPGRPGIGAPDGGKAHSGFRSMHWGRHVDFSGPATGQGTTVRYRQVSAFVLDSQGDPNLPGIALGPSSTLEFWHLIRTVDISSLGCDPFGCSESGAFGGGEVQISLLGADGRFEKWRRVEGSFNPYSSPTQFTLSICEFDPGDDSLPPADDTMCTRYMTQWSVMGDAIGTDATCTVDTDGTDPAYKDCGRILSCSGGPGCAENGSIGTGVWVRSAFNLSPFAGRLARLRWIGMMGGGWSFGTSRSALEPNPGQPVYQYGPIDDGWFLDDILLTDVRQAPLSCTTDDDGDGVPICMDCDDTNPLVWGIPGEATDLTFQGDGRTLTWSAPAAPGGVSLVYDTMKSSSPSSYDASAFASCLERNGGDLTSSDTATPAAGKAFYYLVRPENACPYGMAPLGTDSAGKSRSALNCN